MPTGTCWPCAGARPGKGRGLFQLASPKTVTPGARPGRRTGPVGRRVPLSRGRGPGGAARVPGVRAGAAAAPGPRREGVARRAPPGRDPAVPLCAAADGIVIADREIPSKTNEIPEIRAMLRELGGRLISRAGLSAPTRSTRSTTWRNWPLRNSFAQYVLTVKKNQRGLYDALQDLCWAGAAGYVTEDKGHGRAETRARLVMDAPEEIKDRFPHVRQVARVVRTRTVAYWKGNGKTWSLVTETSSETVYLVTSLAARKAGPEHIAASPPPLEHREPGSPGPRRHASGGSLQGPGPDPGPATLPRSVTSSRTHSATATTTSHHHQRRRIRQRPAHRDPAPHPGPVNSGNSLTAALSLNRFAWISLSSRPASLSLLWRVVYTPSPLGGVTLSL